MQKRMSCFSALIGWRSVGMAAGAGCWRVLEPGARLCIERGRRRLRQPCRVRASAPRCRCDSGGPSRCSGRDRDEGASAGDGLLRTAGPESGARSSAAIAADGIAGGRFALGKLRQRARCARWWNRTAPATAIRRRRLRAPANPSSNGAAAQLRRGPQALEVVALSERRQVDDVGADGVGMMARVSRSAMKGSSSIAPRMEVRVWLRLWRACLSPRSPHSRPISRSRG